MAAITWRNVDAPEFRTALDAYRGSSEALERGLAAARQGITDWRTNQTRESSNSLMMDLMTRYSGSPDALIRDARSGAFQAAGYDPRMLSAEAIASIGARQQDLQNFEIGTENTRLARSNATGREQEVAYQGDVQDWSREDRAGVVGVRALIAQAGTLPQDQARALLARPENQTLLAAAPREEITAILRTAPEVAQLMGNVDLTDANRRMVNEQTLTEPVRREGIRADTAGKIEQTAGMRQTREFAAGDRQELEQAARMVNEVLRDAGTPADARTALEARIARMPPRAAALARQQLESRYPGLYGEITLPDGSRIGSTPTPVAPPPPAVPPAPQPRPAPAPPAPTRISATTGFNQGQPGGQPDVVQLLRQATADGGGFQPEQPMLRRAATTFGFDDQPAAQFIQAAATKGGDQSKGGRPRYPNSAPADRDYSGVPFQAVRQRIQGGESASAGGYNALAYNTRGGRSNAAGVRAPRPLTEMTLGEVYDFQRGPMRERTRGFRGRGDVGSTGAGAYQFESGTLRQTAERLYGRGWRNIRFTPENQDRLAEHLYNSVRGNRRALGATWATFAGGGQGGAGGAAPVRTAETNYGLGQQGGDAFGLGSQQDQGQGPPQVQQLPLDEREQAAAIASIDPAAFLMEAARNGGDPRENLMMEPRIVDPVLARRPTTNVAALLAAAGANARRIV
jgi:hypothetical protein